MSFGPTANHFLNNIAKAFNEGLSLQTNDPLRFYGSAAAAVLVIVLTIYLLYRDHVRDPPPKPLVPEEEDDLSADSFLGPKQEQNIEGKTDTYAWQQTDQEMELFVYLPEESDGVSSIGKRDVKVSIQSSSIKVELRGRVLVEGKLFAEVLPDESNWQILEDGQPKQKKIWLILFKKTRTNIKDYWSGPFYSPVQVIDTKDPQAAKKAAEAFKQSIRNQKS